MNVKDIANLRLASQRVARTKFDSPKQLVAWMGAMQAQDQAMVKWAVGLRLLDSTEKVIEAAMDRGDIIRTHVLRSTWHIVSSDDLGWMLAQTAPRIQAGMRSRYKELELTEAVLSQSRKVMERTLRDGNHSTREELIAALNKANIKTDENRASHLLVAAELDGLICSGAIKNGKQTYALLEERVPRRKSLNRDQALASLANRYFSSRGPATLDDFNWWSGLSFGDAKRALEMIQSDLASETIEGNIYWYAEENVKSKSLAFLLPAFDEFIISYKNRSATITFENHKRAISNNGMFHPTIVFDGETVGIWKRIIKKDEASLDLSYFVAPTPAMQKKVEAAINQYVEFLGKKPGLITKK